MSAAGAPGHGPASPAPARARAPARAKAPARASAEAALPRQREVEVAEGIVALLQDGGGAGVSNACLLVEDGRALVVDAMLLPEMALGLQAALRRRGARPTLLLHTHHHLDHLGGAAAFGGVPAVGHPLSIGLAQRMPRDTAVFERMMPRFAGRLASLRVRLPEPFEGAGPALPLGGELRPFGPAHTPMDLALWFPQQRVLLAADLCFNGVTPLAIHGRLQGWVAALDELVALDPAVVVPGHGPLAGRAELVALRDYLGRVLAHAAAAAADGASVDEAVASFDPGPAGDWLEPERSWQNLAQAIAEAQGKPSPWAPSQPHALELDGGLRRERDGPPGPPPTPDGAGRHAPAARKEQ